MFGFTHKTIGIACKTLDFTRKTFDFFWLEDFIEINKRQQTHHTHTKYTIYIE